MKKIFTVVILVASVLVPVNSANAVTLCPAGTVTSAVDTSKCIAVLPTATPTTTQELKCVTPAVLVGENCVVQGSTYTAVNTEGYTTCPNGGTPNGYVCVLPDVWHDGYWTTPVTISPSVGTNYSCSSGYLSGSDCIVTTSVAITTNTTYSCLNSSYPNLSANKCWNSTYSSYQTASASTNYSCPDGYTNISNATCQTTSTIAATPSYYNYCSSGYLSGSVCVIQSSQWVAGYSTPGGTYNGTWISGGLTCPNGGDLVNTECVIQDVLSTPTVVYSGTCPAFYQLDTFTGICNAILFDPATILIGDIWTCVTTYQDGSTYTRSYYYDASIQSIYGTQRTCTLGVVTPVSTATAEGWYICSVLSLTTGATLYYVSDMDESASTPTTISTCNFESADIDQTLEANITSSSTDPYKKDCDTQLKFQDYLTCLNSRPQQ